MRPRVVVDNANLSSAALRIRELQAQAKSLAGEQVKELLAVLATAESMAFEIAEGGEVFAPGIRDVCRRLAEDLEQRSQTIEAIQARR